MNEELKIIISAEVSKVKKGVKEAQEEIKSFKGQVSKALKEVDVDFKKIGEGMVNAGKKIAKGTAAAATALLALGASTQDYRAEQAKLTSAFETAGASAETAKGVYNDLYRVLGESDTSVEAANHLAQMTTNQKELSEWTNICQGVYATFGDSLPIEGLTESANETAKVGQVTGSLADALNWAGISEDDFNEKLAACNSEAEREKLIRETLSGVYDEASKAYEKNATAMLEQNEAQARLKENLAKLGEAVAPVVTAFTNFANEALVVVVPYIQQLAEKYVPVLKDALSGVAEALQPVMDFIAEHFEQIALMAGIIMAIAVAIQVVNTAMAIYNSIKTAYTTITTIATAAQTAFAAANWAALAPILLVIAAIAAVIAIIVICVKHWDEIKAAVVNTWNTIVDAVKSAVEAVINWFKELFEKIAQTVENIKSAISEKFEAIKNAISEKVQAAKDKVVEIFTNIKNGISEKINAAKDAVSNVFTTIKNTISNKINAAKESVLGIFDKIKNGIKDKINAAKETVSNVIEKIKSVFNFKWSLPKLKMPHIKIKGEFSLVPPKVPKFSIDWYAQGGVFDKPTLFNAGGNLGGLGEAGAEAIVPLEKNTKWLDRIATMLSEKQGAGTPIVLQVDGKTFAQTSISAINQLTKQTGSIGLVLR